MKIVLSLLFFSICGLALTADPDGTLLEAPGVQWHDDLDAAFGLAADEGRPLLIVFR